METGRKFKLGLIVNPVAGIGGSVALKGSDGVAERALSLGAVPRAEERAAVALSELSSLKDDVLVLTGAGVLGEDVASSLGFDYRIIYEPVPNLSSAPASDCGSDVSAGSGTSGREFRRILATSGEDTKKLIYRLLEEEADLVLFAGGDGTARDIYSALAEATVATAGSESEIPDSEHSPELSGTSASEMLFLGIPAGVKIHSPVYAKTPVAAGRLAASVVRGETRKSAMREVCDLDEDLYRRGIIGTSLFGYLRVPESRSHLQNRKVPTPSSEDLDIESIAEYVVDSMRKDVFYIIGAGSTTMGIADRLGLKGTLIGVDIVRNGKLAARDVYGELIEDIIGTAPAKLIVTITGGQGFLFGRGNQQLTPGVLRRIGKENILVVATSAKLAKLGGRPLMVDTGDPGLDEELSGYIKVRTSVRTSTVCRVSGI